MDGAATATLDDVYYVNLIYCENTRGRTYYYAEAVSIMDGTEVDVELDVDDPDCEFDISGLDQDGEAKVLKDLYIMDVDDGTGELYRGQDGYSLSVGCLSSNVTSSSSTIRLDANTTGSYGLNTYDDGSAVDSGDIVDRLTPPSSWASTTRLTIPTVAWMCPLPPALCPPRRLLPT